MKTLARIEELAEVLLSIYLFSRLPFAWWIFPLLFFAPDLSLLGLMAGKRVGAISYNLIHHKAVALAAYLVGSLFDLQILCLIGVVLFGHSSFDRALGFSLLQGDAIGGPAPEAGRQVT